MISLEQALESVFKEFKGIVLDIGCSTGRNIKLLIRVTPRLTHVIGLDINITKLKGALEYIPRGAVSLICSSASILPLRDQSIDVITATLMLHELSEELVNPTLDEVLRVLKKRDKLVIADKVMFKPSSPSEELTLLTEEVHRKALLYAKGIRT